MESLTFVPIPIPDAFASSPASSSLHASSHRNRQAGRKQGGGQFRGCSAFLPCWTISEQHPLSLSLRRFALPLDFPAVVSFRLLINRSAPNQMLPHSWRAGELHWRSLRTDPADLGTRSMERFVGSLIASRIGCFPCHPFEAYVQIISWGWYHLSTSAL